MPVGHHDLLGSLDAAGIAPIEVFALAAGLADALAKHNGLTAQAARECAPAFVIGLAVGVRQRAPQETTTPGYSLTDIVGLVALHGRHTIIAQHCDLKATATRAAVTATLICQASNPTATIDDNPLKTRTCVRLFESGLATGLLLPDKH